MHRKAAVVFSTILVGLLFGLAPTPARLGMAAPAGVPTAMACGPSGWSVVPSGTSDAQLQSLEDVTIVAPDDIWAVGITEQVADATQPLIKHWNGSTWSTSPIPPLKAARATLRAIGVVSANDIWAAGTHLLHWDGVSWSEIPAMVATDTYVEVIDLAVASASDIYAITNRRFALHWDGTTWSEVVDLESARAAEALAADDVWAVGSTLGAPFQHWDGQAWTEFSSAGLVNTNTSFNAISARSSDDVWALGTARVNIDRQPRLYPTSAHWDGSAWTVFPLPNPGTSLGLDFLSWDIATSGTQEVWAVGFREGPSGAIIWHWDGTGWSLYPNPEDPATRPLGSYLLGIDAYDDQLWAVGAYYPQGSGPIATYVEHYPDHLPSFADVRSSDPFYSGIEALACRGVVSGYTCDLACDGLNRPYFRPTAASTRAQLVKIVVAAEGWELINPPEARFRDVPPDNPFYRYIETAATNGAISGFDDNTFRPYANITRGQLAKIIVLAEGWKLANPTTATFSDVPATNPFYREIETAFAHGIISGYDTPGGREFRWFNNATRGQIAKIVHEAVAD